ncbi:MAG: helix-turn-helix transcriptional regulator [Desulfatitalea sp.]
MLAPMKKSITEKFAELCIRVPAQDVAMILELLKSAGHSVEVSERELLSVDEVFPDSHPGKILRGLRVREGLTQAQLSEKTGLNTRHISEMEHGKRPIGKAMAKRLATALGASYRMFL